MARTNAPTPEEARQIETVLRRRNETFADAWALNLNLALRISDLLALTVDDVPGNVVTIKEKKTDKLKVFPINNREREFISYCRKTYPEHQLLFLSNSNRGK